MTVSVIRIESSRDPCVIDLNTTVASEPDTCKRTSDAVTAIAYCEATNGKKAMTNQKSVR